MQQNRRSENTISTRIDFRRFEDFLCKQYCFFSQISYLRSMYSQEFVYEGRVIFSLRCLHSVDLSISYPITYSRCPLNFWIRAYTFRRQHMWLTLVESFWNNFWKLNTKITDSLLSTLLEPRIYIANCSFKNYPETSLR